MGSSMCIPKKTIPVISPSYPDISPLLLCVAHRPVFAVMRKLHTMTSVLHILVSLLVPYVSCSQEHRTSFYTAGSWFHQLTSKRFFFDTACKPPGYEVAYHSLHLDPMLSLDLKIKLMKAYELKGYL